MTSMIHSKTYSPVLFQKIKVTTELYGVNCKVYTPMSIPEGFMAYGEILYYTEPKFESKLLIPKVVLIRNYNEFTDLAFLEEPCSIWSVIPIPKYSKILVNELTELISFIVTDIKTTEDPRFKDVYYEYILSPSSSITADNSLEASLALTNEKSLDEDFENVMHDMNRPALLTSSSIKVSKL